MFVRERERERKQERIIRPRKRVERERAGMNLHLNARNKTNKKLLVIIMDVSKGNRKIIKQNIQI